MNKIADQKSKTFVKMSVNSKKNLSFGKEIHRLHVSLGWRNLLKIQKLDYGFWFILASTSGEAGYWIGEASSGMTSISWFLKQKENTKRGQSRKTVLWFCIDRKRLYAKAKKLCSFSYYHRRNPAKWISDYSTSKQNFVLKRNADQKHPCYCPFKNRGVLDCTTALETYSRTWWSRWGIHVKEVKRQMSSNPPSAVYTSKNPRLLIMELTHD
jgi:hypothetical protein